MIADIVLIFLFTLAGALLALIVEFQKYLYPFYLALVLFVGAGILALLEKAINLKIVMTKRFYR